MSEKLAISFTLKESDTENNTKVFSDIKTQFTRHGKKLIIPQNDKKYWKCI
jgi:hypothetical protein